MLNNNQQLYLFHTTYTYVLSCNASQRNWKHRICFTHVSLRVRSVPVQVLTLFGYCAVQCCHRQPIMLAIAFNKLRPRQNCRRFADDTFKRIFLNENVRISIKISLKFVPKGPINNNPALVQIMAWRRSGDKPLSEPMMVSLLTHICVTRLQWVKLLS